MKCPYCNTEHPESMQYCPNTGQRLQKVFKCPDKENIREFVRGGTQKPSKKSMYSGTTSDLMFDIIAAILCVVGVISGIIVLSIGELWGLILLIGFSLIGAGRIWARKDFYHFK